MSDVTSNAIECKGCHCASFASQNKNARAQNSSDMRALASSNIDLRDFVFILWRRRGLIVFILFAFFILGWLVLSFVRPIYTAEAMIKIENTNRQKVVELTKGAASFELDNIMILNEVEVLQSRALARQIIEKYGLMEDPELNPLLNMRVEPSADLKYRSYIPTPAFKSLSFNHRDGVVPTSDLSREVTKHLMDRIVINFLKRVVVHPVNGSHVIKVEYSSSDAKRAAKITNAVINTYLSRRLEESMTASRKYNDWLEDRLKTLSAQVRISKDAVERYRNEKKLMEGLPAETPTQEIFKLNTQRIIAKSEYAEALARLSQVQKARDNSSAQQSTAEVLKSDLVTQLKMRQSDLQGTLSELSGRYGYKHPSIINIKSELAELSTQIDAEINTVLNSVENEVEVAKARVNALEENINAVEGIRSKENQDMIRLRAMVREAEANRVTFEKFLEIKKRSDGQDRLAESFEEAGVELRAESGAEVLSYAVIPEKASYPNRLLFLSLVATVAFLFAIGICLFLEKFNNAFKSVRQLEEMTGRSCYGLIPVVERAMQSALAEYIIRKPASSLAEAVRTLRTVLKLRSGAKENSPKVVAVTSSLPGEGKSTLSSWLSRTAAKSGERVILIDGDLRRPTVHKMIDGRGDKTIVEYLAGQAKLEDIIKKDTATGLHKIYARSVPSSALDLIDSEKMKNLVKSLRKVYDLVIIDTPASLAVSDARVLATLADHTLYCVHWDRTPREVVLTGVKQFTDIGCDNVSFVLTNVDINKYAKSGSGCGVTPYYYDQYKQG